MEKMQSAATVTRIKGREDFEILFRENYSTLCGYANTFLKDPAAAEEIVQEVMLKIWTQRDTLLITTSVRSYLFRAVRNGCMNLIKHITVREDYKQWNEQIYSDAERSGEDLIIATELEKKIRKAIDDLPLERRKIFIMSRYDGLTYAEIAGKLNLSVKTVENQMGSALKSLRKDLSEYLPWLILFFFDIFRE